MIVKKRCIDVFHYDYRADGNVCLLSDNNVGLTGALQPSEEYDYYEMNERSIDCSDMFMCENQKCINKSLVCDGKNNCGDRTDEICDLENLGYEIRLGGSNNTEEGRLEVKGIIAILKPLRLSSIINSNSRSLNSQFGDTGVKYATTVLG